MLSWVISFTNGKHPLVLQEVPPGLEPIRDPDEGDVSVDWRGEHGVTVWVPNWAMPGGGGPKRTFYPWHVVTTVEEYGEEDQEESPYVSGDAYMTRAEERAENGTYSPGAFLPTERSN